MARFRFLPAAFLASSLLGAGSPIVVIVNAKSGVTEMTQTEATNLFMGLQKRLASGLVALPVEPVGDEGIRSRFYQLLVNASLPQIRSYWARMYFSGQAQPPRQAKNAEEVIEVVLVNRGAVGFVELGKLDHRVRGVLVLKDKEQVVP